MVFSGFRKAPLAVLLMLGCAVLPAQAGWFSSDDKPAQKTEIKPAEQPAAPATNLEDSIRQAQLLRLAGQYPEAVKHLSQMMMVASDDPRVVSEYGKTLASMGRASDAVNFLTRAQQLQPTDWTNYSAMGVAYDQLGDQKSAQGAYEHALALKPDEPSVLSNYALSRLLAQDTDMARKLAARAESAGGASDPKIARNVAMIRSLAPEAPVPAAVAVAAQPQAAPVVHTPPVTPAPQVAKAVPQAPVQPQHDNRVVMQRVPIDPLAGPVASAKPVAANAATQTSAQTATQAPRPLQPQLAAEESHGLPAPKPVASQPLPALAVKPAEAPKPTVPAATAKLTPATPVKTAETVKPAAVVKAPPAPVKAVETASASVTLRLAPPLKGETDKPAQPPKVLPPTPVKAAAKDAVPGLRVSTNAY
jgi:Flp pilus assembly protein TadD